MTTNPIDHGDLPEVPEASGAPAGSVTTIEDVTEALKDVVDPELGINVVDLGLVYGVHLDDDTNAVIDMTLTSAACPLTDVIQDQTNTALEGMVNDVAHQLGLDAAVGSGQDHRRRPRAAAGPGVQRLRLASGTGGQLGRR